MSKHKVGGTDVEIEGGLDGSELTIGENKVKLDKEGNFVGAEAFGNIMEKIEGGMKITRPDGSVMIMHDSGGVSIEKLVPESVGIKNLAEVESYEIRETDEGRVHRVNFVGGGHVETTYLENGTFVSLSGNNVLQSISNKNEILISQGTASATPNNVQVH